MVDNEPIDFEGEGEEGGFDFERLRELWGFVKNAARRRYKLALVVFVGVASAGIGIAAVMPRSYEAEAKITSQRTTIGRIVNNDGDQETPGTAITQTIMRRENLVALVRDARLVDRFAETRPKPLQIKDRIMAKLFGPVSRDDMEKAMVGTLETKLSVKIGDDGIIDVTVDWSNAQIAYDLATLVQTNFLAAKYDNAINEINESISILDDHAKTELANVDTALDNFAKVVDERVVAPALAAAASASASARPPGAPPRAYAAFPRSPGAAPAAMSVDPEVAKALEEKRAQIKSLEESQQLQLTALRQQLSQDELTLTPMHPTIITLQQRIDALSQPSPELAHLRAEEQGLMAQIVPPRQAPAPSPPAGRPGGGPAPSFAPASAAADAGAPEAAASTPLPYAGNAPDGQVQLAQAKLDAAVRSYQDAVAKGDNARVELDLAHATFLHRYQVFSPAELPRKPKKATATLVGVASVFASILLALLIAAAADLGTGVVIEPWQVRRRLKLDVIGELDNPS
jgi:uncharacterized protein involved in exopolysaccharide biosynthesis